MFTRSLSLRSWQVSPQRRFIAVLASDRTNGSSLKFNAAGAIAVIAAGGYLLKDPRTFIDPDFPPNNDSLTYNEEDGGWQKKMSNVAWQRPPRFWPVYRDGASVGDIKQGSVGDCYFLSAVGAMSQHPESIYNILDSASDSDGKYTVRMCKNGTWQDVTVDDMIPVSNTGGQFQPKFCRPLGDELWVLLLEKAWAKMHGSYQRIAAGKPGHVMRDLTGAPAERILSTHRLFWPRLCEALDEGWLLATATRTLKKEEETQIGLVGNHAYSILDVVELEGTRLIKLRNPWARKEWRGKWSDSSSAWTPELKQKLGVKVKDDGEFWMEFEDFQKYFPYVSMCRYQPGWHYTTCDGEWSMASAAQPTDTHAFELVVSKRTFVYLTLSQVDKRCYRKDHGHFYHSCSLAVLSTQPERSLVHRLFAGPLYETSPTRVRDHWIGVTLDPGRYAISVKDAGSPPVMPRSFCIQGFHGPHSDVNGTYHLKSYNNQGLMYKHTDLDLFVEMLQTRWIRPDGTAYHTEDWCITQHPDQKPAKLPLKEYCVCKLEMGQDNLLKVASGRVRSNADDSRWSDTVNLELRPIEFLESRPLPWALSAYSEHAVELVACDGDCNSAASHAVKRMFSFRSAPDNTPQQRRIDIQLSRGEYTAKQRRLLDEWRYIERSLWYMPVDQTQHHIKAERRRTIEAELRREGVSPPMSRESKAGLVAMALTGLALFASFGSRRTER